MAEVKKSFGERFWNGARVGAGLFAGLELTAYLISPVFAANLLFFGALGGAVGGSIYLLGKLANAFSPKQEPA